MIAINKSEKEVISSRLPDVHIVRTMKQKSTRHHYYCEESKSVMRILKEMRESGDTTSREAGANGYRKKTK